MGTRNLTMVVMDGKFKVAQYGQWDGYPSGQGKTVLEFLQKVDLNEFRKKLKNVSWLSKREAAVVDKDKNWDVHYPQLSRDRGADILNFIMTGEVVVRDIDYNDPKTYDRTKVLKPELKDGKIKLVNSVNFAADSLFCEWAYLIDLDKNVLEVYCGFNKSPVSKDNRFVKLKLDTSKGKPEYYHIALIKTYPLDNLPTLEQMCQECDPKEED